MVEKHAVVLAQEGACWTWTCPCGAHLKQSPVAARGEALWDARVHLKQGRVSVRPSLTAFAPTTAPCP